MVRVVNHFAARSRHSIIALGSRFRGGRKSCREARRILAGDRPNATWPSSRADRQRHDIAPAAARFAGHLQLGRHRMGDGQPAAAYRSRVRSTSRLVSARRRPTGKFAAGCCSAAGRWRAAPRWWFPRASSKIWRGPFGNSRPGRSRSFQMGSMSTGLPIPHAIPSPALPAMTGRWWWGPVSAASAREECRPAGLQALHILDRAQAARLVIAGDGIERPMLTWLASELGSPSASSLPGASHLKRCSEPSTYSRSLRIPSKCLMLCSKQWRRAARSPRSTSAMLKDIVSEANREFVVPRDDGAAFAAVLQRLLRDPARRVALGRQNRQRTIDFYSQERMFTAYSSIFGLDVATPGC